MSIKSAKTQNNNWNNWKLYTIYSNLPYYILEIDEAYSDEKRDIEERIIVHKSLVGEGYKMQILGRGLMQRI